MKTLTHEWVKKAEGDFVSAQREYRARKRPNYDSAYLQPLRELTDYAVEFRYPGEFAVKEEARDAIKICKEIRLLIRRSLDLKK